MIKCDNHNKLIMVSFVITSRIPSHISSNSDGLKAVFNVKNLIVIGNQTWGFYKLSHYCPIKFDLIPAPIVYINPRALILKLDMDNDYPFGHCGLDPQSSHFNNILDAGSSPA